MYPYGRPGGRDLRDPRQYGGSDEPPRYLRDEIEKVYGPRDPSSYRVPQTFERAAENEQRLLGILRQQVAEGQYSPDVLELLRREFPDETF